MIQGNIKYSTKKLKRKHLEIDENAFMFIAVYTSIISVLLLIFGEKFATQLLFRTPPPGHVQTITIQYGSFGFSFLWFPSSWKISE